MGGVLMALAALMSIPLVLTWAETGLVPRFPTAILAMGMVIVGVISALCGLILDSLARARIEAKRAVFLSYSALGNQRG